MRTKHNLAYHLFFSSSYDEKTKSDRFEADIHLEHGVVDNHSRRFFVGSSLFAMSCAILGQNAQDAQALPWEPNPVNKRSGVTVLDAEKAGYNVGFVTYLSRFLLNFDQGCQRYWFSTPIPGTATAKEIEQIRIDQFAAFAASAEVGLQAYTDTDGSKVLLEELVQRYGRPNLGSTAAMTTGTRNNAAGNVKDGPSQQRIARSARRHIALLFSLLEKNQPTTEITKLLASVDNGGVNSVELFANQTLSGYAPGVEPKVIFPMPGAGKSYELAQGRAIMKPTGGLLRLEIVNSGSRYTSAPTITISPPSSDNGGTAAQVKVTLGKDGSLKAVVQLIDPGSGYTEDDTIVIGVTPPPTEEGETAVLTPILNMEVDRIQVTKRGSGYAIEKPLKVRISPPRGPKKEKEEQVVALAYPSSDMSSFSQFIREIDTKELSDLEAKFEKQYNLKIPISGALATNPQDDSPPIPVWSEKSSSAELLRLLPAGVGLEFDNTASRYRLALDADFVKKYPNLNTASSRMLGTDFGPRGRAPIERSIDLDESAYLRFWLSGAICSGGVHLTLTPLDVVKTKVQTNPVKYPDIASSFVTVFQDESLTTFFAGWLPTLVGNFIAGGFLYATTEIMRRYLTELADVNAPSLEVPIILASAGMAAAVAAVLVCPFEAVRIRTVAQPNFAANSIETFKRILNDEGIESLINAIPVFLVRNIPYAMTKFTVFDISTERLYEAFPAAQEDIKLSLAVSLVGGIMGGTAAAIVSNPADAVISELKKANTGISPQEAVANMIERGGVSTFFVGLPLRMVFYSLIGSLTFFVYDGVRFLLGIGPDDLKLYLDVLGGALATKQSLG